MVVKVWETQTLSASSKRLREEWDAYLTGGPFLQLQLWNLIMIARLKPDATRVAGLYA